MGCLVKYLCHLRELRAQLWTGGHWRTLCWGRHQSPSIIGQDIWILCKTKNINARGKKIWKKKNCVWSSSVCSQTKTHVGQNGQEGRRRVWKNRAPDHGVSEKLHHCPCGFFMWATVWCDASVWSTFPSLLFFDSNRVLFLLQDVFLLANVYIYVKSVSSGHWYFYITAECKLLLLWCCHSEKTSME